MGREKFSALDMLSKRSLPERKEKQAIIYKDPRELVPTQENFYTTKNISKLKASIKITGYLMQPILIENVDGEDKVLAGHRRRLCCIELIEEGDTRFEKVPCMYAAEINVSEDKELTPEQREAITPFLRQFKVIQANNYRDKNDWERMQEALEMEKIVKGLKEKVGITGTVRENLKELLGVSNAQFGRYKNISNHLSEELMEEFQDGEINISVADAAASLEPELQKMAYEMYMKNKILTLPDIQLLKDQQALNADIPGQMTIEQATRQQKPVEDETPIPVELQIERFFDSLKKNTTARIRNGDKLMGTKMISMLYCYVKHRNGYLNYQGHPDRITFNPDSPEEKEMTWQELTEELIRRYSIKKPVKMTTIDAPEAVVTLTESAAVKAFCEAYPKKLKTIMRICRRCKDNGEAAKAVQMDFAPGGFSSSSGSNVNYSFMSFTAGLEIEVNSEKVSMKYGRLIVEAKNLYDPFSPEFDIEPKKPEVKDDGGPAKCITGQSGSGLCGAAAYCSQEYNCCSQCPDDCNSRCGWILEKSCQSAAETPDEKQQEDHSGDLAEMGRHLRNTDKIPDAWPEDLKDIPVPTNVEIIGYLYDEERKLKEFLEIEKEESGLPYMTILKQQLIVGGLRIIKNLVEDCQEEPEESEQPPLPIMKNNDRRKEWLRNYKSWGLWYEDKNVGIKYYKYDFANGARLIVEEFAPDPSEKSQWYTPGEHHYMHLVGGPKPECKNDKGWSYHSRYNKYPNSETELVEFLKEIQK
ncbi:ParB/RepB/Spo0J family partition protein [Blautia wexlerae]|uniref:ParB/RepB/Spo0J family partition protein n=1 Tax=Blautia wexlerae TaxID=418240 RepID=UPI0022E58345|nr:ParB/RepB/Spo0J family partition protein [Blautia wexlerae]